jgi:ribosome maturation factor RimP
MARRSPREVVAAVRPIAEQLATAHGLLCWGVVFKREAGRETLRVACDRVGGVGSDELALYADDLSRELDHTDAVPGEQRYTLEVTSPGAERRLDGHEQFGVCVGRDARITLRDGRVVEGKIGDPQSKGKVVEVETSDGAVRVFFDDIRSAQLVVKGIA